jgi:methyl-accepting chemotaxis protein
MATGIEAEVASASDRLNLLLGVQAAGVIAALILTRVLVQRPLHRVSRTTERLASGDLAEVEGFARSSLEIRRIADALSVFRDGLIEKRDMEARQEAERAARMAEQQAAVTAIGNALERLSKGDLSQSIDDDMAEGYDKLRDDFNHAQANLRTMLEELSSASAEILASARQLATGSDDLAGRTENQAATLEESVAALDEVTSNVNESARHAQEVRGNLDTAQSDAESSGAVVRDAMEAMQAIKDGSDKISNIIGVIDDIAFQTNLLALNAGVEAARAGAAGRGFAVVAEEVRGLAQRSSESAMEIKALIGDSATQVDRGVDLVGNAGNALIAILEQFKAASGMVAGIARSANEQALSLKEVNTAMTSLDSVTQENAAMVQDSTAATSRLNAEAMRLAELASNFSTGTKSSATHVAGDAAENGPDREVA